MPSKKIVYNETFAYLGGRGTKKIHLITDVKLILRTC